MEEHLRKYHQNRIPPKGHPSPFSKKYLASNTWRRGGSISNSEGYVKRERTECEERQVNVGHVLVQYSSSHI
jgi:hypothetical protein